MGNSIIVGPSICVEQDVSPAQLAGCHLTALGYGMQSLSFVIR
jgi:hypothetical protein